eukprot:COSAG05_NODE_26088_length_191_cov_19.576087_1_plen_27_part_01
MVRFWLIRPLYAGVITRHWAALAIAEN